MWQCVTVSATSEGGQHFLVSVNLVDNRTKQLLIANSKTALEIASSRLSMKMRTKLEPRS